MPEAARLTYLPDFYEDLEEAVQYLAFSLGNPYAALRLVEKVEKAVLKRVAYPEVFEPYCSSKDREWPYYRIYVDNYVVYYVVISEPDGTKTMEVRRLLYGGQNRSDII